MTPSIYIYTKTGFETPFPFIHVQNMVGFRVPGWCIFFYFQGEFLTQEFDLSLGATTLSANC